MVKIDATTRRRQRATEAEKNRERASEEFKTRIAREIRQFYFFVKIFPKLFKILFLYTKSPAGIHGPLNLARGIDSTDEPVQ